MRLSRIFALIVFAAPALVPSVFAGPSEVTINEIMYKPRIRQYMRNLDPGKGGFWWEQGDDPAAEFVELRNNGSTPVQIGGWAFVEGINFVFPEGTTIPAGGHLAVCSDARVVASSYGLADDVVVGNYSGRLADAGERITLVDGSSPPLVVDSVEYDDDLPWPLAPDQDGLSLECMDPSEENERTESWRAARIARDDRIASVPSRWQFVSVTGTATSGRLFFYLPGPGQWLIDDVVLKPAAGGDNVIRNGSFEPDDAGWRKTGSHARTFRTDGDFHDGAGSEQLFATDSGGSTPNSLQQGGLPLVDDAEYTLSCWLKYLSGTASLTIRLSGGGIETIVEAENSPEVGDRRPILGGTPGAENTVFVTDGLPPFVTGIHHRPLKPTSSDDVIVSARVTGDAALDGVTLHYEVFGEPFPHDGPNDSGSITMSEVDRGFFEALLPSRPSQVFVRYRVEATDSLGRSWIYPDAMEPSPNRAYFSYDGEEDTEVSSMFLYFSEEEYDKLNANIFSKETVEATLVVDGIVYDHIRTRYRGCRECPKKSHKFHFNRGDYLRGLSTTDLDHDYPVVQKVTSNFFWLLGRDNIAAELVRLYRNGQVFGLFLEQESPNNSWLKRHGRDGGSEIFKAKSSGGSIPGVPGIFNANLTFYGDPNVYPLMYIKRGDSLGTFSNLIDLAKDLRDVPLSQFTQFAEDNLFVDDWLYRWTVHVTGPHCDFHSKNYYLLRAPEPDERWDVLYFDYDRFWGCLGGAVTPCHAVGTSPFCSGNAVNNRMTTNRTLRNRFTVILEDVVSNLLTEETVFPMLDDAFDRTRAHRRDGNVVTSDARLPVLKKFFADRRSFLVEWLQTQPIRPLANAPPTVQVRDPVTFSEEPGAPVLIEWDVADAEGDTSVVDLYWTDFAWSYLQPIARGIPAETGRYGWVDGVPQIDKRVFVQVVARDGESELVGRHTSIRPITVFDGLAPEGATPTITPAGGVLDGTREVTIAAQDNWIIEYTVDGMDPRVADTRIRYDGPIVVTTSTVLRAVAIEVGSGAVSHLAEAVFTNGSPSDLTTLTITEINYNPVSGPGAEFLELKNTGDRALDLFGVCFTDGIEFAFASGTVVEPGAFVVLVRDAAAFTERYPNVPADTLVVVYQGALANDGEKISLSDRDAQRVLSVEYDDEGFWPLAPDGLGYSLVSAESLGASRGPEGWRASTTLGGSPGVNNPLPVDGGVVINEVLARGEPPFEDAIELFNPSAEPIEVGGWYLSNERDDLKKYRIPDGVSVPAVGYAVFYQTQFDVGPGGEGGFQLHGPTTSVYLASSDPEGNLTGFVVGHEVGPGDVNVSFGRVGTKAGGVWTALRAPSFGVDAPASVSEFRLGVGAENAPPLTGAVVINELMYHPVDGGDEFIELRNRTGSMVSLYDAALDRGWSLVGIRNAGGAVDYEFPPDAGLPASGFGLIVPMAPDVFRERHGVPPEVSIFGPFGGALRNGGEEIALRRPVLVESCEVSLIVVDSVRYADDGNWPVAADGEGPSLERRDSDAFGADPASWEASTGDHGTPGWTNGSVSPMEDVGPFTRGDCDGNGVVGGSPTDAIVLLRWAFQDGTPPSCIAACDAEANGSVGVTDAIRVLRFSFQGGLPPDAPFPECATSRRASDGVLGCMTVAECP